MAQGKNQKKDGTLRIKGADGQIVEIRAGRWYQNPKARPERLMLDTALSADGRRVLDCLELHSIAYGQEACIIQEAGKKRRDLTPADVGTETKLPKQRVRRALVELERAGAAERRSVDGGNLRNGRVRLVCFAEPREIRPDDTGASNGARPLWPDWFPQGCEPLKAYITQQKISLLDNIDAVFEGDARVYFISELEEAARVYFEAAEVVARKLERVRARRNGRPLQFGRKTKPERQQQQQTEQEHQDPDPPAAAAAPASNPKPPDPGPPDPPAPGNAGPAAEEARHGATPAPAALEVPAEAKAVLNAMAPYCSEPEAARKLIAGCRQLAPDCTIAEICAFTANKREEIPRRRKIQNPVGWLIRSVPRCFEGDFRSRSIPSDQPVSRDIQHFNQEVRRLAPILDAMMRKDGGTE